MTSESRSHDFGGRLRQVREGRDLSLRSIADATKISVRALEGLERNDISLLPGGIFSRAFVRAYAREIGVDPEQTVAEFITRFPDERITQGHPRVREALDQIEMRERQHAKRVRLAMAAAAVVVLAIIGFLVVGRWLPSGSAGTDQGAVVAVAQAETGRAQTPRLAITVHALRTSSLSVAVDGQAPVQVELGAGASRTFEADDQIALVPAEAGALEWSTSEEPARALTVAVTLRSDASPGASLQ
jgi:transcriptional regulator with XRE-family HTH domain